MAEQPWLDVLALERLAQQWVIHEVNLPNRQIVQRAPIGVQLFQIYSRKRGVNVRLAISGRLFWFDCYARHSSFLMHAYCSVSKPISFIGTSLTQAARLAQGTCCERAREIKPQ